MIPVNVISEQMRLTLFPGIRVPLRRRCLMHDWLCMGETYIMGEGSHFVLGLESLQGGRGRENGASTLGTGATSL